MSSEMPFLFMVWLTSAKGSPTGMTSDSSARPTVVSMRDSRRRYQLTILTFEHGGVDAHLDPRMQFHGPVLERPVHLGHVGETHAGALGVDTLTGHVVNPHDHVLGRHDDRVSVGRRQNVVGRHHQGAGFQLRLDGKRHVHRHLVTVEVGVESRANQRVQLNRLALDEYRLEGLDAQSMQGRRAIEQYRMLADHFLENIPNFRTLALDQLLRRLDGGGEPRNSSLPNTNGLKSSSAIFFGRPH